LLFADAENIDNYLQLVPYQANLEPTRVPVLALHMTPSSSGLRRINTFGDAATSA
jgi:hypothetical protein